MLTKEKLQRYIELRHDFETNGINSDNGAELEKLLWEEWGFPGGPQEDGAVEALSRVAVDVFGLPPYQDSRSGP